MSMRTVIAQTALPLKPEHVSVFKILTGSIIKREREDFVSAVIPQADSATVVQFIKITIDIHLP